MRSVGIGDISPNCIRGIFLSFLFIAQATFARVEPPKTAIYNQVHWKTGQIIGISEMFYAPLTFFFEVATGSRYGHVGIIYKSEQNDVFVYEANPPQVQRTTLEEFLSRATIDQLGNPEFTLTEYNAPLTLEQEDALVHVMNRMLGVPYNYSMAMNGKSVNCSEFIYKAYKQIGIEDIGIPEPLKNSNLDAFDGFLKKIWIRPLPLEDLAVSPYSVLSSWKTRVVHAGLPMGKILSDQDILSEWIIKGGITKFAQLFRKDPKHCELYLTSHTSNRPYREYPTNWRQ